MAPICLSVYYGFTDYTGMGSMNFVGWENYRQLFHDKAFGLSLRPGCGLTERWKP